MKVFVTGVNGQLGHDVMNELAKWGYTGIGSGMKACYSGVADASPACAMEYFSLDITNRRAVETIIKKVCPDAVIHCAAWTAVDMAEDDDKVEAVRNVNAKGTGYIAKACKDVSAKMVYLSTDYVFFGQGTVAWQPDCKAFNPP